jgi:hypothetical protein
MFLLVLLFTSPGYDLLFGGYDVPWWSLNGGGVIKSISTNAKLSTSVSQSVTGKIGQEAEAYRRYIGF